jgi:hypothetical protein
MLEAFEPNSFRMFIKMLNEIEEKLTLKIYKTHLF